MDREGKGFKATTDVLHFGSANKVVSKANYYIIKKKGRRQLGSVKCFLSIKPATGH